MRVEPFDGNLALVGIPKDHHYHIVAEGMPKRRKHPAKGIWVFPPWLAVMDYVRVHMPLLEWDRDAEIIFARAKAQSAYWDRVSRGEIRFDEVDLDGPFRLPPYQHQRTALAMGRDQAVFAYLMDQGTGKTKVLLDDAAHNYRQDRIDAMLIVAPNSVKTNWVNPEPDPEEPDEVTKHMAPDVPYFKAAYFSSGGMKQRATMAAFNDCLSKGDKRLAILSMNVEGTMDPKGLAFAKAFVAARRCMMVVDESTRIGNRTSKRTKAAMEVRAACPIARIASGTPIIKSPLKAFSQFGFLSPGIIGLATYTEFSARYAVFHPDNKNIAVRYVNTDELSQRLAGVSYRVLKEDCLDLPPKVYQRRYVQVTKKMEFAYKEMRDQSVVWLDSLHKVEAVTALAALTRLQQITAGYLPIINPDTQEQTGLQKLTDGPPPKVEEAVDLIEECSGKVIVWCKYRFEVDEMAALLRERDIGHVTFDGRVSEEMRIQARSSFQSNPNIKVFVGQIQTGGIGITLTAANTVIYLSNTFSTEDRVQSEDRAHRIGQDKSVTYYDFVTPKTVDERVLAVLRANKRLSDEIMRDGYRAWI